MGFPSLRRSAALLTVPALAAGALTGIGGRPADNGIGKLGAAQILTTSITAMKAQTSLLIKGTITLGSAHLSLDIASSDRGKYSTGTLSSTAASAGFVGTIRFVDVAGALYLKAAPALWRSFGSSGSGLTPKQFAKVVGALSNHWIRLGSADAKSFTAGFGSLTNTTQLGASLLTGNGKLTKAAPTTEQGHRVLPLKDTKGGTFDVSLTGPPVPLRITGSSGSSRGDLTFAYPAHLKITAPSPARTLQQVAKTAGA